MPVKRTLSVLSGCLERLDWDIRSFTGGKRKDATTRINGIANFSCKTAEGMAWPCTREGRTLASIFDETSGSQGCPTQESLQSNR